MTETKRPRGRPPMGLAKRPAWLNELREQAVTAIAPIGPDSTPAQLREAASAAKQLQRAAEWFIRHKTFGGATGNGQT